MFSLLIFVAFCVPVQIASLLPAAHWGHERVAQVVFALGVRLDIFPLEVGAAATEDMLARKYNVMDGMRVPASFFAHSLYEIHRWLLSGVRNKLKLTAEQTRRCPKDSRRSLGALAISPRY